MGMFGALDAASTAVSVGQTWMDATSDNIANADTVTAVGQPEFRARMVIARALPGVQGVATGAIVEQGGPPDLVYDPENPLANQQGYVVRPKVDMTKEMTNMMLASRLYQANLSVMQQAKDSYQAALEIGRR